MRASPASRRFILAGLRLCAVLVVVASSEPVAGAPSFFGKSAPVNGGVVQPFGSLTLTWNPALPRTGRVPATVIKRAAPVIVRALAADSFTRTGVTAGRARQAAALRTATINVTYNGFSPAAAAAFQYAVNIWASQVATPEPIDVVANWAPLDPGVLGSAGPTYVVRDFERAPRSGVWYPVALASKLAGIDLVPGDADIVADFSSAFGNWYFGTDGNTPAGQYDFVSVVLHELGHGLGFAGSAEVTNGEGSWGDSGFPYVYDLSVVNASEEHIIDTALFGNPSAGLAAELESNNLFWSGPNGMAGGQAQPRLYAPPTWLTGSSYSHLDEGSYPAGNANSLMTPALGSAEAIHTAGPLTLGMFVDWGWGIDGLVSYEYCYDTTNDGACSAWTSAGQSTAASVTGFAPNTTYYWQVRATSASGTTYADGGAAAFWSFTTAAAPDAFEPDNTPAQATLLGTAPQHHTLHAPNDADWVQFPGIAGEQFIVATTNVDAPVDTDLALYAPNGTTQLAHGAAFGASSRIVFVPQSAGTYYVKVSTLTSGLGGYTLVLNPPPPGVQTLAATAITMSGAVLGGMFNPNGSATTAFLEYGLTTAYGSSAGVSDPGLGSFPVLRSVAISGLQCGSSYHARAAALNVGGLATGADVTFVTTACPVPNPELDLNGDALSDVFLYDTPNGGWSEQISVPGGGFVPSTGSWAPGWSIAAGRFNLDSRTDLFLLNSASGQWFKMLNGGPGSWTTEGFAAWGTNWQRFIVDLNGDGISDVFLWDPALGQWYKCLATPGGFTYTLGFWSTGWEVYPASLNGDALQDFFIFNRSSGQWYWVTGQNGGGFAYPQFGAWSTVWQFSRGDYNADGLTDLVLHDPANGQWFVAAAGIGGFTYTTGAFAVGWDIYPVDLDADARTDLFLHSPTTGQWFEMVSTGSGGFSVGGSSAWSLGWDLYPADFSGDGRSDVLLYNPSTGQWFEARNLALGSFAYDSGFWDAHLTLVAGRPGARPRASSRVPASRSGSNR